MAAAALREESHPSDADIDGDDEHPPLRVSACAQGDQTRSAEVGT
jgi:hypothetical protein